MEGWGINLLWRDIVRPAILVGKYRFVSQESPAFRHGEYVNYIIYHSIFKGNENEMFYQLNIQIFA